MSIGTSDETLYRQEEDRAYHFKKRASETSAENLWHNRARKSKKRACEIVVETAQRQEQHRTCKAKKESIRNYGRNGTKTRAEPRPKKGTSCSHGKCRTPDDWRFYSLCQGIE